MLLLTIRVEGPHYLLVAVSHFLISPMIHANWRGTLARLSPLLARKQTLRDCAMLAIDGSVIKIKPQAT
jgi:hypothetical protein